MSSDRRAFDRLRAQARQARGIGDYHQAARLEHEAAEWAGALGLANSRTHALLWEGYSLRQAGDNDLALASLLQAVYDRAIADPADIFSALIAILHISLERKPFRFCRTLLNQTRDWLFDLRQPWSASLDFLEGELAFRRGEFAVAWDWHSRAWTNWHDKHPHLTPTTHLWALCRTAFRRCDPAALKERVSALTKLHVTQPLEQQLVQRAQLLLWRAWQTTSAPVDLALDLLLSTAGETRDSGAHREILRALALAGRWREIDNTLSRHVLETDCFENRLSLGDLTLNRARIMLGLPVADDEYNGTIASPVRPVARPSLSLTTMLDQAEQCYQVAGQLAGEQDKRLETHWYSNTIRQRQNRLTSLFPSH